MTYGNTSAQGQYLAVRLVNHGATVEVTDGSQTAASNSPVPLQLANNEWHHLVLAIDGDPQISFEADGGSIGTTPIDSLSTNVSGAALVVGDGSAGQSFSQLAIYDAAKDLISRPVVSETYIQADLAVINYYPGTMQPAAYYTEVEWQRTTVYPDHYEASLFGGELDGQGNFVVASQVGDSVSVCGTCTGTYFNDHVGPGQYLVEIVPYFQASESAPGSRGNPATVVADTVNDHLPANPITYHGGPVQDGTNVHLIFVNQSCVPDDDTCSAATSETCPPGDAVCSTFNQNYESRIADFLGGTTGTNGIGGTNYWSLLTQYYQNGDLGGLRRLPQNRVSLVTTQTVFQAKSNNCPATLDNPCITDGDIRSIVNNQIARGLNTDINTTFVLVFANNWEPCDTDGKCFTAGSGCGWHQHYTQNGTDVQYAVIPYDNGCAGATSHEGQTDTPHADNAVWTISHELAEAATDPRLDAWYADLPATPSIPGGEIGDICGSDVASGNAVKVGNNTYWVQSLPQNVFWLADGSTGDKWPCTTLAAHH